MNAPTPASTSSVTVSWVIPDSRPSGFQAALGTRDVGRVLEDRAADHVLLGAVRSPNERDLRRAMLEGTDHAFTAAEEEPGHEPEKHNPKSQRTGQHDPGRLARIVE